VRPCRPLPAGPLRAARSLAVLPFVDLSREKDQDYFYEGIAEVRIGGVATLGGFRVRLSLTDGSTREVDLGPHLNGPVFDPVRNDPVFFRSLRVDEEFGTIVWPNGADIDPDVLILDRMPASFEATGSGSRAG